MPGLAEGGKEAGQSTAGRQLSILMGDLKTYDTEDKGRWRSLIESAAK